MSQLYARFPIAVSYCAHKAIEDHQPGLNITIDAKLKLQKNMRTIVTNFPESDPASLGGQLAYTFIKQAASNVADEGRKMITIPDLEEAYAQVYAKFQDNS